MNSIEYFLSFFFFLIFYNTVKLKNETKRIKKIKKFLCHIIIYLIKGNKIIRKLNNIYMTETNRI